MKEIILLGVKSEVEFVELGRGEYDESNPANQTFVCETSDLSGLRGIMVEIKNKKGGESERG